MNNILNFGSIKLVTFDATNTLLRFKMPPWEYYAKIGRENGIKASQADMKTAMMSSFKEMSKQHPNFGRDSIKWYNWWLQIVKSTFNSQVPNNAINVIADTLINDFSTTKCWSRAPYSLEILDSLRDKDMAIGVISNFDPRLHEILKNVGFDNSFDFVLTSYELKIMKPDPALFVLAMNACIKRVEPKECLHIGDSVEKDYHGARAAGWHALVLSNKIENGSVNFNHVIRDTSMLLDVIKSDHLVS